MAPKASGDREQIVVAVKQGKLTDPAVRSQVEAMLTKVAALGDVASVASPYGPAGAAQISSSGQIAFANVTLTKQAVKITTSEAKKFVDTAKTGATNGVQVELEGQVAKAANEPASAPSVSVLLRRWSSCSWCSARCWPRRCRC